MLIAACRKILRSIHGFYLDRHGLAALEFTLVSFFIVPCMLGVYDAANLLLTSVRMIYASEQVVAMASNLAVQPDSSNQLEATDAQRAMSAIFALFPNWKTSSKETFSVTLTSVVFTPTPATCTTNCTYNALANWSMAFHQASGSQLTWPPSVTAVDAGYRRKCLLPFSAVQPPAQPTLTTLPANVYGPAPILVMDVSYTYNPVFFAFLTGPVHLSKTGFSAIRSGTNSQYTILLPANNPNNC